MYEWETHIPRDICVHGTINLGKRTTLQQQYFNYIFLWLRGGHEGSPCKTQNKE